jgi:hypothetical protein
MFEVTFDESPGSIVAGLPNGKLTSEFSFEVSPQDLAGDVGVILINCKGSQHKTVGTSLQLSARVDREETSARRTIPLGKRCRPQQSLSSRIRKWFSQGMRDPAPAVVRPVPAAAQAL